MTPLRRRMVEDMHLRAFSPRTQQAYLAAVHRLAQHVHKSPDLITDEELRQYFLHLTQDRHDARATITIALGGIQCFFERTLGKTVTALSLMRPPQTHRRPVVLSRDEVCRMLSLVRLPVDRVWLLTIYACGLRLLEGARRQVSQVDGARRLVHVTGKGQYDRSVPLPPTTLTRLRDHWRTQRSPQGIVPAHARQGTVYRAVPGAGPISRSSLQAAFHRAVLRSGVPKRAHVHTRRHSYATHLLEAGVGLRVIHASLGHTSPKTTALSTHLTPEVTRTAVDPIQHLMDGLAEAIGPRVLEVADIVRAAGPASREAHGRRLLPSHRRALDDLGSCRTAARGGHLRQCDHCAQTQYRDHSGRHRHCPTCPGEQTRRWLDLHRARRLPCPYFLVTFTRPPELRAVTRSHQRTVYDARLRAAAETVLRVAADPQHLGARPAILAVLHTWTQDLRYHPHVHVLITGGGLAPDGTRWVPTPRPDCLFPGYVLSPVFRGTMHDALRRATRADQVAPRTWTRDGVVQVQAAGSGHRVREYLGRYVFRIAITNRRLESFANGHVTFRYRERRTGQMMRRTRPAPTFLARFLQHVRPRGFAKVRHDGLASPTCRRHLDAARPALPSAPAPMGSSSRPADPDDTAAADRVSLSDADRCPACRVGRLTVVAILPRARPP